LEHSPNLSGFLEVTDSTEERHPAHQQLVRWFGVSGDPNGCCRICVAKRGGESKPDRRLTWIGIKGSLKIGDGR